MDRSLKNENGDERKEYFNKYFAIFMFKILKFQ